jgi:drug/metabolite transporter (DMT)-like permease
MFEQYPGELAALATAVFWTFTALAFEAATRKVGTYAVNIIRLAIAFIFLSALNYYRLGEMFPTGFSQSSWLWLGLSGLIGFILGDLFLFASYPIITSKIAMLIMTTVPIYTSLISWIWLGESLSGRDILAIFLVVSGISLAIISRGEGKKVFQVALPAKGLLFAFLGAFGQAVGLVISKVGMGEQDAFASTQIRIIAGFVGLIVVLSFMKRWKNVGVALKSGVAMRNISIGSFFGPFLGVSFSLLAVQLTKTGIASTLMSIVPVLIIVPSYFVFKQKIRMVEVIGAVVSIIGVSLFFI